jgi:hypothetical protein
MTNTTLGGWIAGLGALALLGCMCLTWDNVRHLSHACAKASPSASAATVFTTQKTIEIGGTLCLQIDRSRFFAKERAPLDRQDAALKTAEAELSVAQAKQKSADEASKSATGEAKTLADRAAQAAATATKDAEKKAAEARTALAALPQRKAVSLFIDGIRVPAKDPELDIRPGEDELPWAAVGFPLTIVEDASTADAKSWREILGGLTGGGTRSVSVGVGASDGDDQPARVRARPANPLQLRVYEPRIFTLGAGGLLALTLGVGLLGWDTGLLRSGGKETAFSLGRVQMAWWLVLVLGGFLFISLVSGQWRGVITSGVITLLGISASTGVAAGLVDATVPPTQVREKRIFWRDLVEDENGVALHRFQLIIWTVILGAIFLWTVFSKMTFPEFDTNLLLLAGIAGGTYIGFKFPENKRPSS